MDVDDDNDDEDHYSCNSVNFQARTSKFCLEVYQDNNYNMVMMIRIKAVSQSYFAWKYI